MWPFSPQLKHTMPASFVGGGSVRNIRIWLLRLSGRLGRTGMLLLVTEEAATHGRLPPTADTEGSRWAHLQRDRCIMIMGFKVTKENKDTSMAVCVYLMWRVGGGIRLTAA